MASSWPECTRKQESASRSPFPKLFRISTHSVERRSAGSTMRQSVGAILNYGNLTVSEFPIYWYLNHKHILGYASKEKRKVVRRKI